MLRLNRTVLKFLYTAPQYHFSAASKGAKGKKRDYSVLTHYEILSVSPNATQKQIKAAYYELAKKFHPDTYKGTDTEFFKYVQSAYETLKNPEKRKDYDMKTNSNIGRETPNYDEPSAGSTQQDTRKNMFDDIKLDEDMNFDKEYEKFFGKPIETHPEEMVPQEHIFLEQLNREERQRYEYKFMKNNMALYMAKFAHRETFEDIVNSNIQLANKKYEMSDEVKQKIHEENEKTINRRFAYIQVGILLIIVPAVLMAWHRRVNAHEHQMQELVSLVKQEEEFQIRQLQRNFVFEGEK